MDKNEIVVCYNCGFEYPIGETEPYSKEDDDRRICMDCKEGDVDC